MSYKIFDFADARFSKSYLSALPQHHLSFLVSSSIAANDISVFSKLMIGYSHQNLGDVNLVKISAIHQWVVRRVLNAKMIEFINLFRDYAKMLNKKKHQGRYKNHAEYIDHEISEIKNSEHYDFAVKLRNSSTNHYLPLDFSKNLSRYKDTAR